MGNLPIGQGLSVTPMQMAAAYSAIANGGILRPPRLVLDEGDTPVARAGRPPGDQHADGGTAAADARGRAGAGRHRVRGQRSRATPWPGKTGTAQVAVERRLLGHPVRRLVRRLRPGRRTRSCWSRWSSTSPRATTTAARSPPPPSARSPSSRCPTSRSRRTRRGRRLGGRRQHDLPGPVARPGGGARRPRIAAMKLRELLADAEVAEIAGDERGGDRRPCLRQPHASSRARLFFCVPGQRSDGHDFAARRSKRGAAALVVERLLDLPVTQVRVADARAAMAPIAVRFWGDPTAQLRVAGVTGTNGKTTTAFLIRHVLEAHGTQTGLLGHREAGGRRSRGGGRANDARGDRPPAHLSPHARGGR